MTTKQLIAVSTGLIIAGALFSACSILPSNSANAPDQSEGMMQPPSSETEMAAEADLQVTQSDSTDLTVINQELSNFKVLDEDFSDL